MGIYSTLLLSREECLTEICNNLETSSDEDLAHALWVLLKDKQRHNFSIVDAKDSEYVGPLIEGD